MFFKREIDISKYEYNISKFSIINKKSLILKLNPFLDENGIPKDSGLLKHAKLQYNTKHSILMLGRHSFNQLIVHHEHKRLLHVGTQMTLSSIRQNFWPCAGRNIVCDIISKCVTCFLQNHLVL